MNEVQVKVRFDNITIQVGSELPGIATPVVSFKLGTFEYGVDLNGQPYIINSGVTGGDQYRYLVDKDNHKWRYSADDNGGFTKEDLGVVVSQRTFWIMVDDDDFIWLIGADLNGGFDSQYLQ